MLEVNNFNAIRISLASPEQIREWSSGEVTKPETINYRTLKPEKDGLFDERIFGPTKDWECYCGKYKRIRYKGIICDKCGVEVTRAKVRRERMGHIQLASPVSHIWYFKGTPSPPRHPARHQPAQPRAHPLLRPVHRHPRRRGRPRAGRSWRSTRRPRAAAATARPTTPRSRSAAAFQRQQGRAARPPTPSSWPQLEQERTRPRPTRSARPPRPSRRRLAELEDRRRRGDDRLRADRRGRPGGRREGRQGRRDQAPEDRPRRVRARRPRSSGRARPTSSGPPTRRSTTSGSRWRPRIDALREGRKREAESRKDEIRRARDEIESLQPMLTLTETDFRYLDEQYGSGPAAAAIFWAGMGAEAVRDIITRMDLEELARSLHVEVRTTSGQRRKKAIKRLRLIEAFRRSGTRPEWMILSVLPVIPPDLRPMVQLDGGRFATSDLNDLYRRVINRNNRLKRLLELGAPEIIIRNEKRMLQEACDALIDNGRRGRAIAGHRQPPAQVPERHAQGQAGPLPPEPARQARRLLRPLGHRRRPGAQAPPVRPAQEDGPRAVQAVRHAAARGEGLRPQHQERQAHRRARRTRWSGTSSRRSSRTTRSSSTARPTLHRLGIQAFMPVLVEGSAIQIHPLVCTAFNADFDGDQMAVHVPLSTAAQEEARTMMLSTANLLSPADGEPGRRADPGHGPRLLLPDDGRAGASASGRRPGSSPTRTRPILAYELRTVTLHEPVEAIVRTWSDEAEALVEQRLVTTVGRIIFNQILPDELRFAQRGAQAAATCAASSTRATGSSGPTATAHLVDGIKRVGFDYATRGGMTIAVADITVPPEKQDHAGRRGRPGRRRSTASSSAASSPTTSATRRSSTSGRRPRRTCPTQMMENLDPNSSVSMMTTSGARGNKGNIGQLGAMRGLMADPSGRIIDVPVRSNFREGLTVLEYFISTHGARKGLADTALRTADSGYLTRRLVDVAQDVITRDEDCGTEEGSWITRDESRRDRLRARRVRPAARRPLRRRAGGRPQTGEIIVERNERDQRGDRGRRSHRRTPASARSSSARRSPARPATASAGCATAATSRPGRSSAVGEAVGIIAAQSIGEPGTQLTMRTFHTGGVAAGGADITAGLPRVEELFEARVPKGKAEISQIDGIVEIIRGDARHEGQGHQRRAVRRAAPAAGRAPRSWPRPATWSRRASRWPALSARTASATDVVAPEKGILVRDGDELAVRAEDRVEREYSIPHNAKLLVENGQEVSGRRPDHRRPDQPAGVPRHARQGRRAALPGEGGPEGLPDPGRHDQRQAHRDHRPADAAQGPHRPAGRHGPPADASWSTASTSRRPTTASWPRAASPRPRSRCCSA